MSIQSFQRDLENQMRDNFMKFGALSDKWPVIPHPIGRWLTAESPSVFRAAMRTHKVKPADLVAHWLNRWSVSEPVQSWGKDETVAAWANWSPKVRKIFAQRRQEAIQLFAVSGKLTGPLRVTCGRYGAWWAVAAAKPIVDIEAGRTPEWDGRTLEWLSWVQRMNRASGVRYGAN